VNAAAQDLFIGDIGAIVGRGVVGVLVDYISGEVNSSKDALVAGVGEEGRVGGFGGGGRGAASDGTGCYGGVAAELDFVVEEALEGVAGGADEDEISRLASGLKTEAGTAKLDEGGSAPAMTGAAGNDALTVLSADKEGALLEARNDGDAGGFGSDVIGDAFVGRIHELMKYLVGGFDAVIELLHVGGGGCSNG